MSKLRLENARFGLHGPSDLLDKLLADILRLEREATSGFRPVAFAAFDCAVAAWSLLDWTFHAIEPGRRAAVGVTAKSEKEGQHQLQHFLMANRNMDWLTTCHDLATGAKHFYVNHMQGPGWTTAGVAGIGRPLRAGDPVGGPIRAHYWAYIEIGGAWQDGADFFKRAYRDWKSFLDDLPEMTPPSRNDY